jgi:hypothetical protein
MRRKDLISKEIDKIISETFKPVFKEAKKKPTPSDKETGKGESELITVDYLNTNEEDYLTFAQKVALIGGDANDFVELFKNAFFDLQQKGVPVKEIVNTLAPGIPANIIRNPEDFANALTGAKVGVSKDTGIAQNYIDPSFDEKGQGEEDTIKYHDEILNSLKSYFGENSKDAKAKISQNLAAHPNKIKLSPHGFWQIQFLSRILKGREPGEGSEPKFAEEDAIYGSSKFDAYSGRANKILKSFYEKAFVKPFMNLTGRYGGPHPNDVEFEIYIENAWDKVVDNIDKYDESRQNFGAWAFSVAKNNLIDNIRKVTDYKFIDGADAYDVFTKNQSHNNDWSVWKFKKPMNILLG